MLTLISLLVVLGSIGLAALGSLFVLGMRSGWPPVVDRVRRLNRERLNPEQLRTAGRPGADAGILEHTGRVSGTSYRTPLGVMTVDGGIVIVLVYGERTEWLKNVLAAGGATVIHDGQRIDVDRPEVVPIADAGTVFSRSDRLFQWLLGTDKVLRLHRVAAGDQAAVQ